MTKLFRVAAFEYGKNVFKRTFVIALLSVPMVLGLVVGVGIVMTSRGVNNAPVGYVDHAGLLAGRIAPPVTGSGKPVELISFATERDARAALDTGRLQAYFVVAADYFETNDVDLFYFRAPGRNATRQFHDFIRINLLAGWPSDLAWRALSVGDHVTVTSLDGKRHVASSGPTLGTLMPLLVGIAFLFLLLSNSGYLLQAVVEEKEGRSMEVLATSVSPLELIGGKVVGIVCISLTQLAVWTAGSIVLVMAARWAGVGWLQELGLDWQPILVAAALAIPCFLLASALMVATGAVVTSSQESQAVGVLFGLLHGLPVYLAGMIVTAPHGPLSVTLTFLPFTALMTVVMRSLFASVPGWQVAVSFAVQGVCAVAAIWLAGRAFRLGMLRYGKRLRLAELVRERGR